MRKYVNGILKVLISNRSSHKDYERLIYILFLLIGFEQALFAQKIDTLRTERLELRLEPDLVGFIPCGKEWFQVQKDAWKLEIDKDVRNEKAWNCNICFKKRKKK